MVLQIAVRDIGQLTDLGIMAGDQHLGCCRDRVYVATRRCIWPLLGQPSRAVPEWRTTLDALLSLPEIGGPVGYEGMTSIGIRLAVVEPRISAVNFFAQGFVPGTLREEARQVTIPLQFLMQWDDEGMERQPTLDLFDAFGTKEKTLHANLGGHAGTPWFEVDDGARFFTRHLK
jgi:hypothetical protein